MAVGWGFVADLVARPPRARYDIASLGSACFLIEEQVVQRADFQVKNRRGQMLECSHYYPLDAQQYPIVIYCHGNCGSRGDADAYVNLLLPAKIGVVSFDFSGAGMSEGDFCTLGYNESEDLRCVIDVVSSWTHVTSIGLWGRSMGAAAAALCAADDHRIDAMVLDSCFQSIEQVALEVAHRYLRQVPFLAECLRMGGFMSVAAKPLSEPASDAAGPSPRGAGDEEAPGVLRDAVEVFRAAVEKRCMFDIRAVNPRERLRSARAAVLFAHAHGDELVFKAHSEALYGGYACERDMYIFEGDHNSERPVQFLKHAKNFLSLRLCPKPKEGPPEVVQEDVGWVVELSAVVLLVLGALCVWAQLRL